MYGSFRTLTERVLRIPGEPEPPPGDEKSTRLFRAAPRYYYYLLVTWALRTLVVLLVLLPAEILPLLDSVKGRALHKVPGFLPVIVVTIVVLQRLVSLALLRLDYEKRWYLVTNRSLRVREGVLHIREMTITFANIQNISISQGPIQRLLGLADLRVDTAGGGAQASEKKGQENFHGVHFRGVNNAEEVRALINTRLRQRRVTGLGDHDEKIAVRPAVPLASSSSLSALRELAHEASALRRAAADYLPSS